MDSSKWAILLRSTMSLHGAERRNISVKADQKSERKNFTCGDASLLGGGIRFRTPVQPILSHASAEPWTVTERISVILWCESKRTTSPYSLQLINSKLFILHSKNRTPAEWKSAFWFTYFDINLTLFVDELDQYWYQLTKSPFTYILTCELKFLSLKISIIAKYFTSE